MKFEYFDGFQRTPGWYEVRVGKPTASRLKDWMGVSKRGGKPLKARENYERELRFEQKFQTTFDKYVNSAMDEGVELEAFAVRQYEKIQEVETRECGAWYNDNFCASPDRTVGKVGLVEIKVLKDNKFTEVLENGVPEEHWMQIQGQLWASGRSWCDYVAINMHTKKMYIRSVLPDKEFFKDIEESITEPLTVKPLSSKNVHNFVDDVPEGVMIAAAAATNDGGDEPW